MIITNASEQLISLYERVTGCEVSGIKNTSVDYLADIIEGELDANEGCIKKLRNQSAQQQKEIAELVCALDKLLCDAYSYADQIRYEYGIGKQVYDDSIINAEIVLAKYNKGEQ